jgi:hypothetical protein
MQSARRIRCFPSADTVEHLTNPRLAAVRNRPKHPCRTLFFGTAATVFSRYGEWHRGMLRCADLSLFLPLPGAQQVRKMLLMCILMTKMKKCYNDKEEAREKLEI